MVLGDRLQTVADATGACSSPGVWLSALLEGAHVLLGGRREDRIRLRPLLPGDLEEVSRTAARPSQSRWYDPVGVIACFLSPAGCCTAAMMIHPGLFTCWPNLAAATWNRKTSSLCCR